MQRKTIMQATHFFSSFPKEKWPLSELKVQHKHYYNAKCTREREEQKEAGLQA